MDESHQYNATAAFLRDYLIQTRKEIDVEKAEHTRLLHLKIIVIGAMLAFAEGTIGLVGFVVLPLAVFALDLMQRSRNDYIFDRWKYLDAHVVPALKRSIATNDLRFFEQDVVGRHDVRVYEGLEEKVRTIVFIPILLISVGALGVFLKSLGVDSQGWMVLSTELWLLLFLVLTALNPKVYYIKVILVVSLIVLVIVFLDGYLWTQSSIVDAIERALPSIVETGGNTTST